MVMCESGVVRTQAKGELLAGISVPPVIAKHTSDYAHPSRLRRWEGESTYFKVTR
jgi:hypothetical protein